MSNDFQKDVETIRDKAVEKLREWDEKESAHKYFRRIGNVAGLKNKTKTRIEELVDENQRLALEAEDENVRIKAINNYLQFASGSEKVTNVQNNFVDFLKGLKDE